MIVVVVEFVQPLISVPVTVYVLVEVGIKLTPSVTPPDHVYVVAPLALKVTDLPSQTVEAFELAVTAGKGFTVTIIGFELSDKQLLIIAFAV